MIGPRRSFTLLELLAMVTLLAMVVGITTVHLPGITYRTAIEDTATRVTSVFRLCKADADRTGLPRVVRLDEERLVMRRPVRGEQGWEWRASEPLEVGGAKILSCRRNDGDDAATAPPWDVRIRPGSANGTFVMALRAANGQSAALTITPGNTNYELAFTADNEN